MRTHWKEAGHTVSLRYFRWGFTKQNDEDIGNLPGRPQAASCRIGLNGASMRRFPWVVDILLSKNLSGNSATSPYARLLLPLVIASPPQLVNVGFGLRSLK